MLFWSAVALSFYGFLGYPLLMWLVSRLRKKAVNKHNLQPTISVVMAVRNGGASLPAKLKNLRELSCPKELIEYVVASDGSTDETVRIITSAPDVRAIICPAVGKAEALNRAVSAAKGDIVVFTDVRQEIEPEAISELAANFADQRVGCVSGELMFRSSQNGSGVSAYWRFEKAIRKWESASGSVMGATGALYAVRRSLIPPVPPGTILDDVYIPLQVIRQNSRVVFEPNARAWDDVAHVPSKEFDRKVRTLAGNFQLLERCPAVLLDRRICFRFVSHKLMRLMSPWLLLLAWLTSWSLSSSPLYLWLASMQTIAYAVAALAMLIPDLRRMRLLNVVLTFSLMNTAALLALIRYLQHRNDPSQIWTVAREEVPQPTAAHAVAQGQ
jgi:cellulose synthase/poly-beta-1,6-N-acetylglucosamine synthase-like glycosyltransferase